MTLKTVLAAAGLTALPTPSMAMGCTLGSHSEQSVGTCGEGHVWDATSLCCVDQATS